MSANATVTAARNAEGNLIAAIDTTTHALGMIGQGDLDRSLARLQAAAAAARGRLDGAAARVHAALASVAADFDAFASELAAHVDDIPLPEEVTARAACPPVIDPPATEPEAEPAFDPAWTPAEPDAEPPVWPLEPEPEPEPEPDEGAAGRKPRKPRKPRRKPDEAEALMEDLIRRAGLEGEVTPDGDETAG